MNASELLDLIATRRTVRTFDPERPVPDAALERVLQAASWAPLSVYAPEGWRFVACRGEARAEVVERVLRDHTVLKYVRFMYEHSPLGREAEWSDLAGDFGRSLGHAPVVVVALVQRDEHRRRMEHNLGAVWAAAQNMLLQATAEGLSTGIVTLSSRRVQVDLLEHLGFDPDAWRVAYLLNLGFSDEVPPAIPRDLEVVEIRG